MKPIKLKVKVKKGLAGKWWVLIYIGTDLFGYISFHTWDEAIDAALKALKE